MDTEDIREYEYQGQTLSLKLCVMSHKCQSRFLQMYQTAIKNGIDKVEFIKVWNSYAQDISEHVFWEFTEPQKKFTERGK